MKLRGVLLALVEEGSFDCDPTNGVGSSLSMILGGGKLRETRLTNIGPRYAWKVRAHQWLIARG